MLPIKCCNIDLITFKLLNIEQIIPLPLTYNLEKLTKLPLHSQTFDIIHYSEKMTTLPINSEALTAFPINSSLPLNIDSVTLTL